MRAAMRAASPYLFAMLSPVKIVSDFRRHGVHGSYETILTGACNSGTPYSTFVADFAVFVGVPLVAAVGPDISCQNLIPPSMALLLAPRTTSLGRSSISLALPPPRRTESQTSAARRRSMTSSTDFLQRSTPRRSRPLRPT